MSRRGLGLQARIDVVTRTNSYQVRTGDYSDEVISVYLIVRRYWGDRPKQPMDQLIAQMAEKADKPRIAIAVVVACGIYRG